MKMNLTMTLGCLLAVGPVLAGEPAVVKAAENKTPSASNVDRRSARISFIDTGVRQPGRYGWPVGHNFLNNVKHCRYIEYDGYLWQGSGDLSGYPFRQLPEYPPKGVPSLYGNSSQDMWRADVSPKAVATGRIEWELSQNYYHNYPWEGTKGHFTPEPQRGPYAPDALGWLVDNRGDFWMGPYGGGYEPLDKKHEMAGVEAQGAYLRWRMPGLHDNGIRLGNGWSLPKQLSTVPWTSSICWTGRTGRSTYDPQQDCILEPGFHVSTRWWKFELRKFPCLPGSDGVHRTVIEQVALDNRMMPWPEGSVGFSPQPPGPIVRIGRELFMVIVGTFHHPQGGVRKTFIARYHLDRKTLSTLDLPAKCPWWIRTWDGPHNELVHKDIPDSARVATTGQYRGMVAVGTKLVVGPDFFCKIGVDPWFMAYDTVSGVWELTEPPQDSDWPNTIDALVAVESLGEAWLIGSLGGLAPADAKWYRARGLYLPSANNGRRILRFQVESQDRKSDVPSRNRRSDCGERR